MTYKYRAINIIHDFFTNSDDDQRAVLQYDYDGKVIDMYHTGVPPAFRGKGVAKLLAKVVI